jgi:ferredoxin
MIRKIVSIDRKRCDGCGLCVSACHEGAIGIREGTAALLREDYCDGLGNCLPVCPAGAIRIEERDAPIFDAGAKERAGLSEYAEKESLLDQWPVQIRLIPESAPYFEGCDLLVAADCSAYTYGDFHRRFMKDRITVIGCPKLDAVDYSEKLGRIMAAQGSRSITVFKMEVPCCGGIEYAVKTALKNSGKSIPLRAITLSIQGSILEEEAVC